MAIDLQHGERDLCRQMACPTLIKKHPCIPSECVKLDTERKQVGAIYMVRPDGVNEDFVGVLPTIRSAPPL